MIDVNLITPASADEIFAIIEAETNPVYFLAGGTDLVIRAKDGIIKDSLFLNIKNMNLFRGIVIEGDFLKIGALTTHTELIKSNLVNDYATVLALAASAIGSPQIRNMGTIGGNVANASPAGDTIPALYTLDTDVIIISKTGERSVKIYDFFKGPGKTTLNTGELIKEFHIPLFFKEYSSYFKKLGQRRSLAISKLNIAVNLKLDDEIIQDVRIAFGAAAPTVIRAVRTEEFLLGKTIDDSVSAEACVIASDEVAPIDDVRSTRQYRSEMAGVLLNKILRIL